MERFILPKDAERIISLLQQSNESAYIVGGCVRDIIMKRTPHDWDICTSASPEKMLKVFGDAAWNIIPTGLKHGTVTVVLDGEPYEVTTYRIDGTYSDGRHPDKVEFSNNLEADLARRDFTMNAIAYSPTEGLIDPFFGQEDIRKGIIRCVGDPHERFREDALRIMRAIRFASTLGYRVEQNTGLAAIQSAERLSLVSPERISSELMKMLSGENVKYVLELYREIVAQVIPEVRPCFGFRQNNPYHIFDVWEHIVHAVDHAESDPLLRLIMLLHDIGKPLCYKEDDNHVGHFHGHAEISADLTREIMKRLRFSNQDTETVVKSVTIHDRFIEPNSRAVRRLVAEIGSEQFDMLMRIRTADILAQNTEFLQQRLDKIANLKIIKSRILKEQQCLSVKDLAISGQDLIALGMKPGPNMGKTLNTLLHAVIENPKLNSRETLLELATKA